MNWSAAHHVQELALADGKNVPLLSSIEEFKFDSGKWTLRLTNSNRSASAAVLIGTKDSLSPTCFVEALEPGEFVESTAPLRFWQDVSVRAQGGDTSLTVAIVEPA